MRVCPKEEVRRLEAAQPFSVPRKIYWWRFLGLGGLRGGFWGHTPIARGTSDDGRGGWEEDWKRDDENRK